jgi:hypothetical protein
MHERTYHITTASRSGEKEREKNYDKQEKRGLETAKEINGQASIVVFALTPKKKKMVRKDQGERQGGQGGKSGSIWGNILVGKHLGDTRETCGKKNKNPSSQEQVQERKK